MKNQTLEQELVRSLKKKGFLYTRLRTPGYGYRGVRYPADFVLWLPNMTALIECKQRKELPLRPSDVRQLPFMKEWEESLRMPLAKYFVLTSTEADGYCLFTSKQLVYSSQDHRGLKKEDSWLDSDSLDDLLDYLLKE